MRVTRMGALDETARAWFMGAALLAVMIVAGAGRGLAQTQYGQTSQAPTTQTSGLPPLDQPDAGPEGPVRARMEEQRLKTLNDDRHKRLAADVDRLVALTNELKTDVDKTTKDELSLDVIKKAQEIEKLAHDVQSRMKN